MSATDASDFDTKMQDKAARSSLMLAFENP